MDHQSEGRWALGSPCRLCRRPNALFHHEGRVPVVGAFAFQCAGCGAHNTTSSGELKRLRLARPVAADAA